jgi:hypothetical protein
VNALAAAAPNLSNPTLRAGLLVPPSLPTASAGAAVTTNGFPNLISVLLGALDSGNAYGDPSAAPPGTELPQTASANAPYQPAASNADIAQALIRSMLGGKTMPITFVADRAKTPQTKARQATGGQGVSPSPLPIAMSVPMSATLPFPASGPLPASGPFPALLPASAPLPISAPLTLSAPGPIPGTVPVDRPSSETVMAAESRPEAPSGVGGQESPGTGASSPQAITTGVTGAMASPPLAFSARLTPLIENGGAVSPPAEYSPAELPVAISSDAKSKAVESPSPHVLLRNDTRDAALPIAAVASTPSSDGFGRGFENPAPPTAAVVDIAEARLANAFGTVAETLRSSETASAASSKTPAAVPNSPIQEIAVRIAQPAMPVVDLQVTERAGEIHVAVRTPDASLETLLRQDLATLTNSLERAGYRAETYVPGAHEEAPRTAASPQMDFATEGGPSGQGSSGRNPGESSQGQQQRQRHHNPQDWNDEMEQQQ